MKTGSMEGRGTLPRTRWAMIMLLVATGVVAAAHIFKMSPAMPLVRQELDLGLVAGGWLFSVVSAMAMIAGAAAGSLSDRFGHVRVLTGGLVIMGLASVAGSFSVSAGVLMICRFAEGAGFLAIAVAVPSLITREAPMASARARALAFWGVYNPVGGALVLLFAPLVLVAGGWRLLWTALGVASLVAAIAIILARPRRRALSAASHARPPSIAHSLVRTASRSGPWLAALAFGFYTLQYSVLMTWLVTYLVENRGVAVATAGLMAAVVIAVNIVGNLAAGALLARGLRPGTVIIATAVLMGGSAGVIFSGWPDTLRYAGCVALSLFGGMIPGTVFAATPLVAPSPDQIGTVNGFIVQGSHIGMVTGPPLGAAIVAAAGAWEALLWLAAGANLVIAALGYGLLRRDRTGVETPAR